MRVAGERAQSCLDENHLFWIGRMRYREKIILVIDQDRAAAENVRQLIEFMDTPAVVGAQLLNWREQLAEHRLEALFVGPELTDAQISTVLSEVAEIDPNIPVVMLRQTDL